MLIPHQATKMTSVRRPLYEWWLLTGNHVQRLYYISTVNIAITNLLPWCLSSTITTSKFSCTVACVRQNINKLSAFIIYHWKGIFSVLGVVIYGVNSTWICHTVVAKHCIFFLFLFLFLLLIIFFRSGGCQGVCILRPWGQFGAQENMKGAGKIGNRAY